LKELNVTPRLRNAFETAYKAFGSRRLGRPMEVCRCKMCMSDEMERSILRTPLRELSREQLYEYTNSAHGWSDEFLYFIPRYMELIERGEELTLFDKHYILSRFKDAPENRMSAAEEAALGEWLLALFEDRLLGPISDEELDEAADSIGVLYFPDFLARDLADVIEVASPTPFDTAEFQRLWESCRTREADLRLAGLILLATAEGWSTTGAPRKTKAAWWSWLSRFWSDDDRLVEAFERETDEWAQKLFLAALG
jgi:hypothetical protein